MLTAVVSAGFWQHGEFDGHGVLIECDHRSYSGQFKNGELNGHGKQVLANGTWYCGCFKDGKRSDNTTGALSTFSGNTEGFIQPSQGIVYA